MTVVFSGWSVLSPFGVGREEFEQGLLSGGTAVTKAGNRPLGPLTRTCAVPGFDIRSALGPKGTRIMDRSAGLTAKAVGLAVEGLKGGIGDGARVGLVVGTTAGSLQSLMNFVKDSFVQDKPFQVDPARFPNAVMNRAASHSAIWHGLRGPNTTIAAGRAAALLSMQYARRLHSRGRADTTLCGVVEELSEHRAWVEYTASDRLDRPLGEGCAVFALELPETARRAGRTAQAALEGIELGVWSAEQPVCKVLSGQLRRMLERSRVAPREVGLVVVSGAASTDPRPGFHVGELSAIHDVISEPNICNVGDIFGDTGAATGGMQLAALLSRMQSGQIQYALMTSVDLDGVVGCALIRQHV